MMFPLSSARRSLCLLGVLAAPLSAQGGGTSCCETITPHVLGGIMTRHEGHGSARHEWLQSIVLWRSPRQVERGYPLDSAPAYERVMRAARFASEEAGRQLLGGFHANGFHSAEYSQDRSRLWVLGREYPLPDRDSALVVMVDVGGGAGVPDSIVGHAYIPAELPERYWGKSWTSGDTSYFVRPRRTEGLLLDALRHASAVRIFLGKYPLREDSSTARPRAPGQPNDRS
ncbi:MAG TPA: hypothetical protein VGE02_12805 [Gemmatimonadales bacterium]